ncbi:hypothetical protein L1987_71565 [Smallanthus sonchifolius]|uniref:Uncharacterized protein n=1 Tax=Smallanthus sonchifolius TaxID=185202 RepID=A0ACB9ATN1_9ASTR|nr:hypothetical protein L1987_71565 [Smallanthus sonchifolius]
MMHIPFSWEKIPGVPKFVASPMRAMTPKINRVLPMPPGCFRQPARRPSKRMLLWEEDPFLVAMILCTKDCDLKYKGKGEIKKSFGTKVGMTKFFLFSCKHSFDVEEGNLSMTPFNLGSNIASQERVQGLKIL